MPGGGAAPAHHPPNMLQPMEDMVLPPKRQAVVDRLRRRIETYRRRQTECVPRFDQSFTGACEQQNLETTQLQKRFLEGKAKRQVKKTDRKPDLPAISGNLHSSVHVQQKFGCGEYEPPASLQCGVGAGAGEALTKFSVEIVQQLEFTTSAADSQPQQISTNVTVKALANAVKTSGSPPPASPLDCERVCKAECKSEVADDEYVGLEECAAALERDAASAFPGLADLIGEDERDDAFEELMTDISEYAEFDFDLDGGKSLGDLVGGRQFGSELAPAAQTLRNMAEQHQAAAADWRYRPYARRQPDLALSQHQQLQLSQPHLQVSAAQHMQVSGGGGGHVSVAAQQGMYASFHSQAPSPQHHQGGNCESYSVSQSQSINLGQGGMRPRPAPAQPPPSPQQPLGVAAAGMSREHQAKMLQQQQQQMLRAQQQQMRPPPPEYKARFANVNPNLVNPSGMAGAGGIAPGMVGAPGMARRPPARQFAPHARQYAPEWRHVMMQQQNRQQFTHHHQGFGIGSMTMTQQQQQQMQLQRMQQQQLMQQQQQQRTTSQQNPMSHLIMQQNQMMNVQGQMQNIQMTQSQSMSMHQGGMGGMGGHQGSPMQNGPMQGQNGPMQGQNGPMQGQNGPMQGQNGPMHAQNSPMHAQNSPMQNSMMSNGMQSQSASSQSFLHSASSFPGQTADFNLDFLDNMPSTDASNLTAQELLNSLDNSFLNDIL